MKDYKVVEIDNCNISLLQNLADESIIDGHPFIQKTIDEWRNGIMPTILVRFLILE